MTIALSNLDEIIARYEAGTSLKRLAADLGVSRAVLYKRFEARGVPLRSRSQAEYEKWRRIKRDPAGFEKRTRAFRFSRLGVTDSEETRAKRAAASCKRRGRYEAEIAALLRDRGIVVAEQLPVGSYNVDLAIPERRIVVEVFSANPGLLSIERLRKRTSYLMNEGWGVVFVVTYTKKIDPNLHFIAHTISSLPRHSGGGWHAAIGGDGKPLRAFCDRQLAGLCRLSLEPGLF